MDRGRLEHRSQRLLDGRGAADERARCRPEIAHLGALQRAAGRRARSTSTGPGTRRSAASSTPTRPRRSTTPSEPVNDRERWTDLFVHLMGHTGDYTREEAIAAIDAERSCPTCWPSTPSKPAPVPQRPGLHRRRHQLPARVPLEGRHPAHRARAAHRHPRRSSPTSAPRTRRSADRSPRRRGLSALPGLLPGTDAGAMELAEMRRQARAFVDDPTLTYRQRVHRLAALAENSLDPPPVAPACAEALDKRVICDMYEGNAPYRPALRAARLRRPCSRDGSALPGARRRRATSTRHWPSCSSPTRRSPRSPATRSSSATSTRCWSRTSTASPTRRAAPQAAAVLDLARPACSRTPSRTPTSGRTTARVGRVAPAPRARAAPGRAEPDPARSTPTGRRTTCVRDAVRDRLRVRQAALRQPPDDGRRPRPGVRRGVLLQLAARGRRLAHAGAAQPREVALRHRGARGELLPRRAAPRRTSS